jgi:large subunit ribosomal protein L19
VSQELINKAAASSMKSELPRFEIGDTVNVSVRIVEGEKERVQVFTGTVIGRQGGGVSETFTVRRIVNNQGVERIFPIHSPKVAGVEVVRSGKTRRAKLYFLRDRIGKATRLKEVRKPSKKASKAAKAVEPSEPVARAAEE